MEAFLWAFFRPRKVLSRLWAFPASAILAEEGFCSWMRSTLLWVQQPVVSCAAAASLNTNSANQYFPLLNLDFFSRLDCRQAGPGGPSTGHPRQGVWPQLCPDCSSSGHNQCRFTDTLPVRNRVGYILITKYFVNHQQNPFLISCCTLPLKVTSP